MAEDAARELPNVLLEDARQLVHLYAKRGPPKFQPAARRWLVRYLTEGTPELDDVAEVTARLARHARRVASQGTGRRLIDVAETLTQSHLLLPSVRRGDEVRSE